MIRPAIIASTRVDAEMIRVICNPDIMKSKLSPRTMSQRNWYLNIALSPQLYGATIGPSLFFSANFFRRPSILIVSTNRLMKFSQIWSPGATT